jgi:shikimate dehydrogenase
MKRACVIGWPISHSLSPAIHGYWLKRYGIDGDYVKEAVEPKDFEGFLKSLAARGFRGANITVPHKIAAFRLCDARDAAAEAIGAVNTVSAGGGKLAGSNTDAFGFLANLDSAAPGWDRLGRFSGAEQGRTPSPPPSPSGRGGSAVPVAISFPLPGGEGQGEGRSAASLSPAVVIGAGGAARAVVWALGQRGFEDIRIVNRTSARAEDLAAAFPAGRAYGFEALGLALEGAGFVVNASTLGMKGAPPLDIDLSPAARGATVCDIVYTPLETGLLAEARRLGLNAVDGLGMLLHQAAPGFEAWFGVRPEVTPELRAAVLAAIAAREAASA